MSGSWEERSAVVEVGGVVPEVDMVVQNNWSWFGSVLFEERGREKDRRKKENRTREDKREMT